ncbi:MAG: myo-inositol-1(or 4)-monophosphatase, partial [Candidatus Krumholzibacteriia bacterium]
SGKRAGATDRTWYIDPLDGTTNYAHGQPVFAVSMACADADGLLLAGVYAPYLDELYLARRGGGARMERPRHGVQKLLTQRKAVDLNRALLATGFPYVRDDAVDLNANRVRDFLRAHCHGVRRTGSAAMDLVHVAAGKLDGYWETTLRSWDTAAGTLIAREAGAIVSDQTGIEKAMHYENILAAAPGLHAVMRDMLAQSANGKEPTK